MYCLTALYMVTALLIRISYFIRWSMLSSLIFCSLILSFKLCCAISSSYYWNTSSFSSSSIIVLNSISWKRTLPLFPLQKDWILIAARSRGESLFSLSFFFELKSFLGFCSLKMTSLARSSSISFKASKALCFLWISFFLKSILLFSIIIGSSFEIDERTKFLSKYSPMDGCWRLLNWSFS